MRRAPPPALPAHPHPAAALPRLFLVLRRQSQCLAEVYLSAHIHGATKARRVSPWRAESAFVPTSPRVARTAAPPPVPPSPAPHALEPCRHRLGGQPPRQPAAQRGAAHRISHGPSSHCSRATLRTRPCQRCRSLYTPRCRDVRSRALHTLRRQVKFLLPLFGSLFGTDTGATLQQLATERGARRKRG